MRQLFLFIHFTSMTEKNVMMGGSMKKKNTNFQLIFKQTHIENLFKYIRENACMGEFQNIYLSKRERGKINLYLIGILSKWEGCVFM